MRFRTIRLLVISVVLLAAAGAIASAMPSGRQVPLDENIIQFFAKNGVDAQYLTMPVAQIPADTLQKIQSLQNDPELNAMILSDLRVDGAAFGDTLYLPLGSKIYEYSRTASGAQESFSASS